ncbi:MAG TPA: LamG domain-containing protein [Verrucomicrobiae bacterium]|nr:LamG domain-containing protein [Verrucomicrobiae bacterium]
MRYENQSFFHPENSWPSALWLVALGACNFHPFSGSFSGAVLLPTNAVPQNQWTHVAGTLDGATGDMRAYINGVLVAQSNTTLRSAAAIVSGYGIGIGASFDNSASFSFHGFVDEVLLYSRALSASDVASLAVTNNSCIPHGATATATLVYGFVVAINLTDSGCGYTNPPLVQINGGGGANATAFATISNGAVTSITVTDAGFGYTSMPEVVIAPPPFIPWLEIAVSQVGVTAHVVLGQTYILETSGDLVHWTQVGDPFTAQANTIREVFDVDATNRFFRVAEVR